MVEISEHGENLNPKEAIIHNLETDIKHHFSEYSDMFRKEYDEYDPKNDRLDRGQVLWFFTEKGRDQLVDSSIYIVFRPDGFVINRINSPEPAIRQPIQNRNDSVFGHHHDMKQRRWQKDEVDQAIEKLKIRAEGIDPDTEAFLNQLAGWSEKEQRFLTMEERILAHKKYIEASKSFKGKARKIYILENPKPYIWEQYEQDPEKAAELAIKRIGQSPIYTTFEGVEYPSEQICEEIRQGTTRGKKAMLRELNIIEAYESLLRERRLL